MNIIEKIKNDAKPWHRTIAYGFSPESEYLKGIVQVAEEGIADVIVVGEALIVRETFRTLGLDSNKIAIADHCNDYRLRQLGSEMAKKEPLGITFCEAVEKLQQDLVLFGIMLVACGHADIFVSCGDTLKEQTISCGIAGVGYQKNISTVSSTNLVVTTHKEFGQDGVLFFSDCDINISPTSDELADIAIATIKTADCVWAAFEPRLALLSFSSKGSASHEFVDKVASAYQVLEDRKVAFSFDGELQLDAAIVPSVGKSKAPNSKVAGRANILIFPDLNAGNIGLNLVSTFGEVVHIGPVLQGFAKPIQWIPSYVSVEDVVNISAVLVLKSTSHAI